MGMSNFLVSILRISLFHGLQIADAEVVPFRLDARVIAGLVQLRTAVGKGVFRDEFLDDVEFVVVECRHLMPESRVAADLVGVPLFLELFRDGARSEETDVGELCLVIDDQLVVGAVTEEGGRGRVVLVLGHPVGGEDGAGVGEHARNPEALGQDVAAEVAVAHRVVGL